MTQICGCKKCSPLPKQAIEETSNFIQKFDAKIITELNDFRPFGYQHEKGWHFSEYFCHYVGHSAIVGWLDTCAERNLSFSNILQDFAFFAVFINDINLVANLARGIVMYMVEFGNQIYDKANNKFIVEEIKEEHVSICTMQRFKIDTRAVFLQSQWRRKPFIDTSSAIDFCMETLQNSRTILRLILVSESLQKSRQMPFQVIVNALVAAFCTGRESKLGLFFIDFFGELLSLPKFTNFAATLKPVLKLLYGKVFCGVLMTKFVNHRCIKLLNDDLRAKFTESCALNTSVKRCDIIAEREMVNQFLDHSRFILHDFFFNYILFSTNLLLFLHLNPGSLLFLNAFRIHLMVKSGKLLCNFGFENLLNYKVMANRPSGDIAVSVAPYCFNCGAFVEKVWPYDARLQLLEKTVSKKVSFRCSCSLARYCSEECAKLHSGAHFDICLDKLSSSVRSY